MKDVMGILLCSCSVGNLLPPFGAISGFLSGKVDGFYSQRPPLRNVVSRSYSPEGESEPQGAPLAWPVQDEGGSEGWSLIDRIKVATSLARKRAGFPLVG